MNLLLLLTYWKQTLVALLVTALIGTIAVQHWTLKALRADLNIANKELAVKTEQISALSRELALQNKAVEELAKGGEEKTTKVHEELKVVKVEKQRVEKVLAQHPVETQTTCAEVMPAVRDILRELNP
ncbi:hypothetical protein [Roseateles albus]|uniref:DUF2570 domain-containing protein n=1 Tax=Roseateles albus TaxID=2987525 RepID=A0ABT5KI01_9BURK|nr:hypothetical protein [Roseateles albus]MDC8773563.1 hypothetical protein [Roseateles albus]